MKQGLSLLLSLGYCILSQGIFLNSASAQVAPDATTNTTVEVNGNNFTIEQGDRAGGNLFHSFSDFSVPNGGSALFNNAADVVNIFSRVTGGNISNIDGLLRANGAANLFLINPAGIIFGAGARLDLGGSFYGSTADSIIFPEGEFSATDLANPPLLTINAPIGLNFRDNPGDIVNRSVADGVGLEVAAGKSLALVGGNISLEGGLLTASEASIELGSVAGNNLVNLKENTTGFDVQYEGMTNFGNIELAQGAIVDSNGAGSGSINLQGNQISLQEGSQIRAETLGSVAGQAISIKAKTLLIESGANIATTTIGEGQAGDINITASESIDIVGQGFEEFEQTFIAGNFLGIFDLESLTSGTGIVAGTTGTGTGGNINLNTSNLNLIEGAVIGSFTFKEGAAGNLTINAVESLEVVGSGILNPNPIAATGEAGDITIVTGNLILTQGGLVSASTFGQGKAGLVRITASDTISIEGENSVSIDGENSVALASGVYSAVNPGALGDAEGITITTGNLVLTKGGQVSASTFGQGNGGLVKITASDTISIDGETSNAIPSGVYSLVNQGAIGNAGDITIFTSNLILTKGGQVSSSTLDRGDAGLVRITASDTISIDGETSDGGVPSLAASLTTAPGNAGGVTITTDKLILTKGGQVSASTLGQGNGGDVTVNARESITISGVTENFTSGITADAVISSSNGGNINVFTDELTIDDGGAIRAANLVSLNPFGPGTGEPGNITIQANSLSLTNEARINAATQSETGNSANINLQITEDITLRDNSFISARALQNADGGNLNINARFILAFPSSNNGNDIIANAEQGQGGNINITAEALLGIEERPQNPLTNDIDASSEFGLDGNVSIVTPDINPIQADIELPNSPLEGEQTVAQACQSARFADKPSGLTVKGRGGIPSIPTEPFNSEDVLVEEEVTPSPRQTQQPEIQPIKTSIGDIYPARGVIKTAAGEIILTAYATDNLHHRTPHISANCSSVSKQ